MKKFGDFVVKNRIAVFIIATILLIPSFIGMKNVSINYDMLTYLPKNLDSTKGQRILEEDFKNSATTMLILENLDEYEQLSIKEKVKSVEGVSDVFWRDDIVDVTFPEWVLPDELREPFYSENSTMMFIKFEKSASDAVTLQAIEDIRTISGDDSYLSGIPSVLKDTMDLVDRETPIYIGIAVILSLIVLMLTQDSYLTPFIFLISIGYSIVYNMGTNIIFGEISYITQAIAAVLQLAVTMDYSIFLYHGYEKNLKIETNKYEAMSKSIVETFKAITGSSLTTISGFLALIVMQLSLGKDIGLVMAKGVFLGLISAVTILPIMLLLCDKLLLKTKHNPIKAHFEKFATNVSEHRKTYFILFILLFMPAVYGAVNTDVYYNLDRSLPKELPSIVSVNKMKKDYDMASTHFIVVEGNVEQDRMQNFINDLGQLDGIKNALAPQAISGGILPDDFIPDKIKDNFKKEDKEVIVMNSRYLPATDEIKNQIEIIHDLMDKYEIDGYLTGEGVLTDDLTRLASRDFTVVNTVSILIVFLIVMLIFKSFAIPLLLVLAIELAIGINMSIPFYTGVTIPFVASIVIGTIQLGSTIDYSILLTTKYLDIRKNESKIVAMEQAVKESASSIIASALSFACGTFGVGIYSDMEIVSVLCNMMARGAIISMIVILVMLPSILLVCDRFIMKTTKGIN